MRGVLGTFLLTAGLSLGAVSHYPGATHRHQSLSELTEIVTGSIARDVATTDRIRPQSTTKPPRSLGKSERALAGSGSNAIDKPASSPAIRDDHWFAANLGRALAKIKPEKTAAEKSKAPRHALAIPPSINAVPKAATQTDGAGAPESAVATVSNRKPNIVQARGWLTAVIKVRETTAPATKRVTSLKPKSDKERWQLVKKLQSHLKRVGCYWGKIDGDWGKGSKRAVKAFMASVNASLPHKLPDYLMLNLLEGQKTAACQSPCGDGMLRATSGQCVEPQVLASLNRRRINDSKKITETAGATWQATVTPKVERHRVASLNQTPKAKTTRRPPPLPGRMAVGAAQPKPLAIHDVPVATPTADRPITIKVKVKKPKRSSKPTVTAALSTDTVINDAETPAQFKPVTAATNPTRSAKKKRRAAKPANAAKRQSKRRYRKRRYGRSVGSLFTHPLGRM